MSSFLLHCHSKNSFQEHQNTKITIEENDIQIVNIIPYHFVYYIWYGSSFSSSVQIANIVHGIVETCLSNFYLISPFLFYIDILLNWTQMLLTCTHKIISVFITKRRI